jgi:hypothetical protein
MDISSIEEIQVRNFDGKEFIFRGNGINKFMKLIGAPLRSKEKPKVTLIEDDIEEDPVEDEEVEPEVPKKSKKAPPPPTANGYSMVEFNYASSKGGKSATDIAKELKRQAESSGIKFG